MKAVKSVPRFRCDFCNRVSGKAAMARHEPRCFYNPRRFCENCQGAGFRQHYSGYHSGYNTEECEFCRKCDVVRENVRRDFEHGRSSKVGAKWIDAQDKADEEDSTNDRASIDAFIAQRNSEKAGKT